MFLFHKFVSNW